MSPKNIIKKYKKHPANADKKYEVKIVSSKDNIIRQL